MNKSLPFYGRAFRHITMLRGRLKLFVAVSITVLCVWAMYIADVKTVRRLFGIGDATRAVIMQKSYSQESAIPSLIRFADSEIESKRVQLPPNYAGNNHYYRSLINEQRGAIFVNSLYSQTSVELRKHRNVLQSNWLWLSDAGIQFFGNRSCHQDLMGKPFLSRKLDLMQRCRSRLGNIDLSRMVYDDKHKLVFCVVPKAACTTWKRVLWYLLGKENNISKFDDIDTHLLILSEGNLPTLNKLSKSEAVQRLATYTTAFVMRNPMHRLVSAFTNKFTNRSTMNYRLRLGRWIASLQSPYYLHGIPYRHRNITAVITHPIFKSLGDKERKEVLDYVNVLKSGQITFQQFVSYTQEFFGCGNTHLSWKTSAFAIMWGLNSVTASYCYRYLLMLEKRGTPQFSWDVHWRPQLALCNPCTLNYDYIIEFNDLAKDSNVLLRNLQVDEPIENQVQVNYQAPYIDDSLTNSYLQTLTEKERKKLMEIYEKDFSILGYS